MARGRNIVRIGQAAGSIVRKELLVRGRNTMRIVSVEGYRIGQAGCEEGRRLGCVICHRDHWVSIAIPDGPLSIIVHDVAIIGYVFQHLTIPDVSVKSQQIIQGLLGGMIAL